MSIKRNTIFNLIGSAIPVIVGLVTVPFYLRIIGEARYGILALVWVATGYFGLFELGMGRATAYQIAKLRSGAPKERESVFWVALVLNVFFGLVGAILLFLVAQYGCIHFFNIRKEFLLEVTAAIPWIALTIPVATVSSVGSGVLQGREDFLAMNVLGVLGTVLNQAVPLATAWLISPQLSSLVAASVFARLFGTGLTMERIRRTLPVEHMPHLALSRIRQLLSFGGWVSVSSAISPVLTTLDRLLIGGLNGPVALTHYTIPTNITQQCTMLSSSLASTLFPRFAGQTRPERLVLAQRAIRAIASLLTPCIIIAILCMTPFLSIWIGERFGQIAAPVAIVALIGIWFNSLARVPFGLLHGSGTPRSTAVTHLCEVPLYVCALYFATKHYGIVGAACVTVGRFIVDAIVLALLAQFKVSWFRYLIPYVGILLLSQIAALWLPPFSIFRFITIVVLWTVLGYLGFRNSEDFALILHRIFNCFSLWRKWHESVPKI